MIDWFEYEGYGVRIVIYKLRDWFFFCQCYWGEFFLIVYDDIGLVLVVLED